MIGYVFDEHGRRRTADLVARFIAMTRKAKEILAGSDDEWERIGPLAGATDAAALARLARSLSRRHPAPPDRRRGSRRAQSSTACWRGSAAASWSALRTELDPGTFYARPEGLR